MHLNTPSTVTLDQLRKIVFGDLAAEAEKGEIFKEVFCQPDWITTFLQGNHTILKGRRGTGKTGLFESLKEGWLKYDSRHENVILVPIDDNLDYERIREAVLPRIRAKNKSATFKNRVIWEFFLIYRVGQKLLSQQNLPSELRDELQKIGDGIWTKSDTGSIAKLLLSSRRKIGIKFGASELGGPTADVYFDFSPNSDPQGQPIEQSVEGVMNLQEIKNAIDAYLKETRQYILVIIDKLDDFTSGDNLKTQRAFLQGLLQCERDYRSRRQIELVLLFRTDLFESLNLEALGPDKVHARCLDITWTPVDLRAFIGRRIAHNFMTVFEGHDIFSNVDPKELYGHQPPQGFWARLAKKIKAARSWLNHQQTFDHKEVRVRNLSEELLNCFIHAFFGNEIEHIDRTGTKQEISVLKFLDTHLAFANGEATPRVMLYFCQLALEAAIDYYTKNPDIRSSIQFPLIPKRSTCVAYHKLKLKLWESHCDFDKTWKRPMKALQKSSSKEVLTSKDIVEALGVDEHKEEEFIAYLMSHGVVSCANPVMPLNERIYKLPFLFRIVKGD